MKYFVGDVEFDDFTDAIEFSKEDSKPIMNEDGVLLMEYKEVPLQIQNEVEEASKVLVNQLN